MHENKNNLRAKADSEKRFFWGEHVLRRVPLSPTSKGVRGVL